MHTLNRSDLDAALRDTRRVSQAQKLAQLDVWFSRAVAAVDAAGHLTAAQRERALRGIPARAKTWRRTLGLPPCGQQLVAVAAPEAPRYAARAALSRAAAGVWGVAA